jgi:hypothetical protein
MEILKCEFYTFIKPNLEQFRKMQLLGNSCDSGSIPARGPIVAFFTTAPGYV